LLGPLNEGWRMAMHTLAHERGPYAMARQVVLRVALDRAIGEARESAYGDAAIETPELRASLARAHVELEVLRHHCYRSMSRLSNGEAPGPANSIDKLLLADAEQRVAAAGLDLLGARGAVSQDTTSEFWRDFYFYARAASIYGGAAQIQKNIVAERVLGLVRAS
jgi:alkylation response protein AidB-like acyl-CoA dehydrogenase